MREYTSKVDCCKLVLATRAFINFTPGSFLYIHITTLKSLLLNRLAFIINFDKLTFDKSRIFAFYFQNYTST